MVTASSTVTSSPVTTPLFIGGKERHTADTMAIADPAKPGVVVGHAASATPQDVRDNIDEASAIELMLKTPSIIKRPVLDTDQARYVGFKPEQYEQIFSS